MFEFFTDTGGIPFKLFGIQHILPVVITFLVIFLIYFNREKLKKFKHMKLLRYIVATILFINMAIFYLLIILKGEYTWKEHLPLHICFFTGYLFMFMLVTGKKNMFSVLYFFTIIGPLPALIWPDLTQGVNRFIFWQYTISHHFLIISSMFCLFVLDYTVRKKDMYRAFIWANVYFFVMYIFNLIFGTNYVMSTGLPAHIILLYPFLKYLDYPILWLEITGILAMLIAYIPVYIINKSKVKKENVHIIKDVIIEDEMTKIQQS